MMSFRSSNYCRSALRSREVQRQGVQDRRRTACPPTETKILDIGSWKSPQKRPVWRRAENLWFATTGWWRIQSTKTRLREKNRKNRLNARKGPEIQARALMKPSIDAGFYGKTTLEKNRAGFRRKQTGNRPR